MDQPADHIEAFIARCRDASGKAPGARLPVPALDPPKASSRRKFQAFDRAGQWMHQPRAPSLPTREAGSPTAVSRRVPRRLILRGR